MFHPSNKLNSVSIGGSVSLLASLFWNVDSTSQSNDISTFGPVKVVEEFITIRIIDSSPIFN